MRIQIGRWGDNLAVKLPIALTQKGFYEEGDILEVEIKPDGSLNLAPAQAFDKKAFLAKLDQLHESLPCTESVIEQMRQEQRY